MRTGRAGLLAVWFVVISAGVLAWSAQAFATATTHIWAPSTDVQGYGVLHLTSDFYAPTERDEAGNRPDTITNLGLTTGVLPFEKLNAEIGFDHKTGLGELDDYPMYFNAKAGIPENAFGDFFPAIAGGIYDWGTEKDKTDYNVLYVKVAKTFTVEKFSLGRFSVGYFNGNDKLLLDGDGEKDNEGILAAWERSLPEISDKLWVCVEYQGSESSYGCMNYGFSYKFSDNVSVLAGMQVYNNRDLADTFTVQVDVDFDGFSKLFKK